MKIDQKKTSTAFSLVRIVKDEIIGSENTFMAKAWIVAVFTIFALSFYLSSPTMSFSGVAGSREANINFEKPVEIKRVHVLLGQRVKRGDLLLELDQTELETRIRQIRAKLAKLGAEKSVRDQLNQVMNNRGDLNLDPLAVEIKDLTGELQVLEREKKNLYVFAEIDGVVGSVNFKKGELAPGFASLLTISPESPTFVQGFVHEKLHSSIRVGSKVTVDSLTSNGGSVEGSVVSVGSRIVEIPPRLAGMTLAPVWGKEVVIEIPKNSQLLLGERVSIAPKSSFFSPPFAFAETEMGATPIEPRPVVVPPILAERTRFEASGIIYLSDLKRYLVVSDDTDAKNSPWMFFMSEEGEVEETPIVIPGLDELNDVESISTDGQNVYIMTSLTASGKRLPNERNIFLRLKRTGFDFSGTQKIELGSILRSTLLMSKELSGEINQEDLESLEVESHAVVDGDLLILLKAPVSRDNRYLLLRIPKVETLFENPKDLPEIRLEAKLTFDARDGRHYRPSDLAVVGDHLVVTTSCKGKSCGAVWSVDRGTWTTRMIRSFASDAPEGVALSAPGQLMIVFDGGKQGSKFVSIKTRLLD